MSGGSLDYLYLKIEQAIHESRDFYYEEIQNYYVDGQNTYVKVYPFQTYEHINFYEHLKLVSKALHDLEWSMDSDIGLGDELEAIRAVLKSNSNDIT